MSQDRATPDPTAGPLEQEERAFAAMTRFARRSGYALKVGKGGVKRWHRTGYAEAAELKQAAREIVGQASAKQPDRPARQTKAEFERRPDTLFHGSSERFDAFRQPKLDERESIFLTSDRRMAELYAYGPDGAVLPVRADLRNPLVLEDAGTGRRPDRGLHPAEVAGRGHDGIVVRQTNGQKVVQVFDAERLRTHRQLVAEALDRGEDVPAAVLADYPDLRDGQAMAKAPKEGKEVRVKVNSPVPPPVISRGVDGSVTVTGGTALFPNYERVITGPKAKAYADLIESKQESKAKALLDRHNREGIEQSVVDAQTEAIRLRGRIPPTVREAAKSVIVPAHTGADIIKGAEATLGFPQAPDRLPSFYTPQSVAFAERAMSKEIFDPVVSDYEEHDRYARDWPVTSMARSVASAQMSAGTDLDTNIKMVKALALSGILTKSNSEPGDRQRVDHLARLMMHQEGRAEIERLREGVKAGTANPLALRDALLGQVAGSNSAVLKNAVARNFGSGKKFSADPDDLVDMVDSYISKNLFVAPKEGAAPSGDQVQLKGTGADATLAEVIKAKQQGFLRPSFLRPAFAGRDATKLYGVPGLARKTGQWAKVQNRFLDPDNEGYTVDIHGQKLLAYLTGTGGFNTLGNPSKTLIVPIENYHMNRVRALGEIYQFRDGLYLPEGFSTGEPLPLNVAQAIEWHTVRPKPKSGFTPHAPLMNGRMPGVDPSLARQHGIDPDEIAPYNGKTVAEAFARLGGDEDTERMLSDVRS